MDWVNSAGGPLICAEVHNGRQWMGITGLSQLGARQNNDYERACGTRLHLEAMACGAGSVLVLGDEPLQSSFFETSGGDLAIARWSYAEAGVDVKRFLTGSVLCGANPVAEMRFEVARGALMLFDSARRGEDAIADSPKADVQPGPYRVTTERWQMDRMFDFIVHRLIAEKQA